MYTKYFSHDVIQIGSITLTTDGTVTIEAGTRVATYDGEDTLDTDLTYRIDEQIPLMMVGKIALSERDKQALPNPSIERIIYLDRDDAIVVFQLTRDDALGRSWIALSRHPVLEAIMTLLGGPPAVEFQLAPDNCVAVVLRAEGALMRVRTLLFGDQTDASQVAYHLNRELSDSQSDAARELRATPSSETLDRFLVRSLGEPIRRHRPIGQVMPAADGEPTQHATHPHSPSSQDKEHP